MTITWSVVNDEASLASLREPWLRLASEHAHDLQLFQTYTWVSEWWQHFAGEGRWRLHVVVGHRGGELVVVWPLARRRVGPVRLLEVAGGLLSCFDDALVRADVNDVALASVFDYLAKTRSADALRLRGVHERSQLDRLLAARSPAVAATTSPFVDCERGLSFDAHWAKRSKRFRSEQRRSWRMLEDEGRVTVAANDAAISGAEAPRLALEYKRRWLAENGLSGKTIASARGEAFLASVGPALVASGEASPATSTVRIDERVIAIGISYRFGRRRYEYLGGFDYDLERCGAGRVQLETSLRASFEQGLAAHDFMTPSTAFKARIADEEARVSQYVLPLTMRGTAYRSVYVKHARPFLKRMHQRLGPLVRRHRV